jgi:virginiamycin A acetyltransferase
MRDVLKGIAFSAAVIIVTPAWISYSIRRRIFGADRALQGSTQVLALWPGISGQYARRAFLWLVLEESSPSVTIEAWTVFSRASARLGENVYIGTGCHIGSVDLGPDVLVASGVHIPSGPQTHGSADSTRPIREQPGTTSTVHIGAGTWIGSAAVVMADVGEHSIVAAGAVVVDPIPAKVVAGGVPARVLKRRE